MTRGIIVETVQSIINEMQEEKWVPYKTGNMALNALKIKIEGDNLFVYFDNQIAPYVPYTNEPWIALKWHNKKNPNQGWWDRFVAEFAKRLANKLKGVIK